MNERFVQKTFWRWNIHSNKYKFLLPNIYLKNGSSEMDILCFRQSKLCDEIEIKLSVKDFYKDFKKKIILLDENKKPYEENKHVAIEKGLYLPNYHWFIIHRDIVDKIDIPDYSGFYVYYPPKEDYDYGKILIGKEAPRLHSKKLGEKEMCDLFKKIVYRFWEYY